MYHAANGRRWVSIPPWSARLGSGFEGVAQFYRPVLGEGTSSDREIELIAVGGARRCRTCFVTGLAQHDKHVCGFEGVAQFYRPVLGDGECRGGVYFIG
jgi:hypothetical protein